MKILFMVSEFPKLSETFILNQITGLIDKGHDVTILSERPSGENKVHSDVLKYNLLEKTIYIDIPLGKLKRVQQLIKKWYRLKILLKSINFVKYGKESLNLKIPLYALYLSKLDFDIIHCHFGNNGNIAVALKDLNILTGKVITTFHGVDMTAYIKNHRDTYKYLFEKGDLFLPISKFWKSKLINLGCSSDKILVHHMGVNLNDFTFIKPQPIVGKIKLVTVARLVEKKGIEYSVKAVAQMIKKGYLVKYSIIGDGPLRNQIQDLIKELKVQENIEILGWKQKNEIISYLKNSNLMVIPSITAVNGDMEGIPVVIMEAMSIGLPVIATYHSGIPEIINDNFNGFLVEEKTVNDLVIKLEHIYNHTNLSYITENARNTIEKEFNISLLNNKLEKIFANL